MTTREWPAVRATCNAWKCVASQVTLPRPEAAPPLPANSRVTEQHCLSSSPHPPCGPNPTDPREHLPQPCCARTLRSMSEWLPDKPLGSCCLSIGLELDIIPSCPDEVSDIRKYFLGSQPQCEQSLLKLLLSKLLTPAHMGPGVVSDPVRPISRNMICSVYEDLVACANVSSGRCHNMTILISILQDGIADVGADQHDVD